jgi:hypothetical protein
MEGVYTALAASIEENRGHDAWRGDPKWPCDSGGKGGCQAEVVDMHLQITKLITCLATE